MKFSYNWLQSFFDTEIPKPKELSNILTVKLFEVEEIKEIGNDWILDIDVLPNRAGDCFSHIGIAREISAILGFKFKEPEIKESENINNLISVEIVDTSDCPRYTAKVITGIEVDSSPKWIKERLEVCGVQSINNVVDIANYIMLETGQPLHIFDMDKISGKIIVRRAKAGEKIMTLDGKECELNEEILVIADEKKLLGIAGIKGGKEAEVSESTRNIVIEAASFNRKVIRKGSAKVKIRTDASIRFEHGFDPNLCRTAINRATELIGEIAGGKPKGIIDLYPKKITPKIISLSLEKTNKLLGIDATNKVEKILLSLGFKIKEKGEDLLNVEIPTRRVDISLQEDLIEEIGRIIGYDKIPSRYPKVNLTSPKRNDNLFWEGKIRELFKMAGFSEVYNHTFISEDQAVKYDYRNLIEVESPVSIEQKYLRPSLVPHIIDNVKENSKFFDSVEIFEIGKIFPDLSSEQRALSGVMTGDSFYQLKGLLDMLFEELGIVVDYSGPANTIYLDSSRSSSILANKTEIGKIGYTTFNFPLFELNLDKLIELAKEKKEYQPLAKYPEMTRDLAIITPLDVLYKEIVEVINSCKISLLKEIKLFDLYQGEGIPKGKKSTALHLTFRGERTLTAEEVNHFQEEIIREIEKKSWRVRR